MTPWYTRSITVVITSTGTVEVPLKPRVSTGTVEVPRETRVSTAFVNVDYWQEYRADRHDHFDAYRTGESYLLSLREPTSLDFHHPAGCRQHTTLSP